MISSSFGGHNDADERVLLDAAREGDERAFGILLERYRPGLQEFCGLMIGDPRQAEHAACDTVLIAWRERGLAAASSSVRMWLYRIAIRACLDEIGCLR